MELTLNGAPLPQSWGCCLRGVNVQKLKRTDCEELSQGRASSEWGSTHHFDHPQKTAHLSQHPHGGEGKIADLRHFYRVQDQRISNRAGCFPVQCIGWFHLFLHSIRVSLSKETEAYRLVSNIPQRGMEFLTCGWTLHGTTQCFYMVDAQNWRLHNDYFVLIFLNSINIYIKQTEDHPQNIKEVLFSKIKYTRVWVW